MPERITPRQFHEATGVQDWACAGRRRVHLLPHRVVRGRRPAGARDRRAGRPGEHHPDVDLRYRGVTVRLITITDDYYGLSERDVELARRISAEVRELSVPADPSAVQTVQVTVDALVDPRGRGPSFWFQQMDAPRPQRNRIHIDVWVPHDQAKARIAAAIAAGGHLVTDQRAPSFGCWPTPRATRPACPPRPAPTERGNQVRPIRCGVLAARHRVGWRAASGVGVTGCSGGFVRPVGPGLGRCPVRRVRCRR